MNAQEGQITQEAETTGSELFEIRKLDVAETIHLSTPDGPPESD